MTTPTTASAPATGDATRPTETVLPITKAQAELYLDTMAWRDQIQQQIVMIASTLLAGYEGARVVRVERDPPSIVFATAPAASGVNESGA